MILDPDILTAFGAAITIITGWIGFLEKRMQSLKSEVNQRLEEREKVNQIVQGSLKEDIARLESKLDALNQNLVVLLLNLKDSNHGTHKGT